MVKTKICYILTKYDVNDHTHFAHIADLLKEAARYADIYLLIERAYGDVDEKKLQKEIGLKKICILKFRWPGLNFLESFCRMLKIRLFNGYKDFYVHYSFLAAFKASVVAKIFGGRVFYWNCGEPWKYKRFFAREFFERLVYKMISFLVTGSNSLAEKYVQYYGINPKKIKIMPNWLSIKYFAPNPEEVSRLKQQLEISDGEKIILFVHRLSRRKGGHLLPEIFRKIKYPKKKLLIIGDGQEKKSLEKIFQKEIAENKVKMLGWVSNAQTPNYYALADVFIMPSEEEGFPRVLLETMAVGTPFAVFAVGAAKEITPPEFSQNIKEAGDVDGFCAASDKILSFNKNQIAEWQKISKAWVQKYDAGKIAKNFVELFK